jgi:histidinol phosphatase-like PHP family hydrolase/predicted nuclease with RNAse H fold/dephospho-CoA kinase
VKVAAKGRAKDSPVRAGRQRSEEVAKCEYFRIRDFEYVQPLYDLAFLLEVDALAKGQDVPKYRTFSLWRAAYSLDGYGVTIDRWLGGDIVDDDLDYVPSSRIRQYLTRIQKTGSIPELRPYRGERFERCLRLRAVRGLGPSKLALTLTSRSLAEDWFREVALDLALDRDRITELYQSDNVGPWQSAHVVPPLIRFLRRLEMTGLGAAKWSISGIENPFDPIMAPVEVQTDAPWDAVTDTLRAALKNETHFRRREHGSDFLRVGHQMGWTFVLKKPPISDPTFSIAVWISRLDPLGDSEGGALLSDLHTHTSWSDGSAPMETMAAAAAGSGLTHLAVTDHSRSSKLQGGLTPVLWLRQANALRLADLPCQILHGIEVDILKDGRLDLPQSLLAATDIVVASVHSSWTTNARTNTDRLIRAIESGSIDILAHPTSALTGKPGVPTYVRPPADVVWDEVFAKCAMWRVALEFNCFPSRLDLPMDLLKQAIAAGCALSIGSDAHARSHLVNRRFGAAVLRSLPVAVVLNRLSYCDLNKWITESRSVRAGLVGRAAPPVQTELPFDPSPHSTRRAIRAQFEPPNGLPRGPRVVGFDLTAGDKPTGVALLDGNNVTTCSLSSDAELVEYVSSQKPDIVSIDSPLGLPGGGTSINRSAGIVRVAEHDLASIGIPAYPALIDSMRKLTLRGIRLKGLIQELPSPPSVIESYPGAAQDILCIPRKQMGLELLRQGLRRLGLKGSGLETRSHDEMDAITSAIVGRYFATGDFEPMGIPGEAQLIVPTIRPLVFENSPIVCLAGKTGAGKSVVARYLTVFYGFTWVRTRDVIRELLTDDMKAPPNARLSNLQVDPTSISEADLREFGAVVLNTHQQAPLRNKLTQIVRHSEQPIVVDSIRDLDDVSRTDVGRREVMTWYVDCSDAIIRQRLIDKHKLGVRRIKTASPVDQTAPSVRASADAVIWNGSSLEDLRWRVDDLLFSLLDLSS